MIQGSISKEFSETGYHNFVASSLESFLGNNTLFDSSSPFARLTNNEINFCDKRIPTSAFCQSGRIFITVFNLQHSHQDNSKEELISKNEQKNKNSLIVKANNSSEISNFELFRSYFSQELPYENDMFSSSYFEPSCNQLSSINFIEGALPSVSKDVLVSQILETKEALEIRFSEYSKLVHTTQDIIFSFIENRGSGVELDEKVVQSIGFIKTQVDVLKNANVDIARFLHRRLSYHMSLFDMLLKGQQVSQSSIMELADITNKFRQSLLDKRASKKIKYIYKASDISTVITSN